MVSAQAETATRDGLLMKLMEWPNQMWFDILAQVTVLMVQPCTLHSAPCSL